MDPSRCTPKKVLNLRETATWLLEIASLIPRSRSERGPHPFLGEHRDVCYGFCCAVIEIKFERKNTELKHLGFVRVAAIHTFLFVSNLYEYAKQNSGSLRSAVGTVENTVTTVLGPVCNKFKGVPDDVLVFVDNKVDEASHKFDEHAPPFAKHLVEQAKGLIEKVADEAGKVASEARSGGPRAAARYAATESKHFLLIKSVKLWNGLNRYPPIHALAEMAVPTAAHCSEKYNHGIKVMTQKGYSVAGYLPLIPIDEIAKAFKQGEANLNGDDAASAEHSSESSDSD
ncbi:REF/SRPP-like protein, partial [Mucuna pruriens]